MIHRYYPCIWKPSSILEVIYSDLRHGVGYPKVSIKCSLKANWTIITFLQILSIKSLPAHTSKSLPTQTWQSSPRPCKVHIVLLENFSYINLVVCLEVWEMVQVALRFHLLFSDSREQAITEKIKYIFSQSSWWMHYFCTYGYQNMTELLSSYHHWTRVFKMLFSLECHGRT